VGGIFTTWVDLFVRKLGVAPGAVWDFFLSGNYAKGGRARDDLKKGLGE
jgi:hypothetical protein